MIYFLPLEGLFKNGLKYKENGCLVNVEFVLSITFYSIHSHNHGPNGLDMVITVIMDYGLFSLQIYALFMTHYDPVWL